MKWLYIALAILAGVPALLFGTIYAASELGREVIVLHRHAADGSVDRVRLWIVDDDTGTWLEHGRPDSAWMARLASEPELTVERSGAPAVYHASPDPESHRRYHDLRREKYGLADQFVSLMVGDRDSCTATPVRLEPPGAR